ncbi:MAG: DUF2652 domain-containing protein [Chloroflexota bacterium]
MRPGRAAGPLILADISGYTSFLAAVPIAHANDAFADGAVPYAYDLMSHLLDGIIEGMIPPFTLAKLEGDAVFVYSPTTDGVPRGTALIDCMRECYATFRTRLASAREVWTCDCDACARVEHLDLKFIIHAGSFIIQPMGGSTELVGSEVVMAHRLLKNNASSVVGSRPYALITHAAGDMLDVPLDGTPSLTETYEHLAPIETHLIPLA